MSTLQPLFEMCNSSLILTRVSPYARLDSLPSSFLPDTFSKVKLYTVCVPHLARPLAIRRCSLADPLTAVAYLRGAGVRASHGCGALRDVVYVAGLQWSGDLEVISSMAL